MSYLNQHNPIFIPSASVLLHSVSHLHFRSLRRQCNLKGDFKENMFFYKRSEATELCANNYEG